MAITDSSHSMVVDHDRTIGERVAYCRRRRHMTQEELARRMHMSVSWVRKIEQGEKAVIGWGDICRLAGVLNVQTSNLTGQPRLPADSSLDGGHASIREVRDALMRCNPAMGSPARCESPRRMQDLRRDVERAKRLRQDARCARFGEMLPDLLDELCTAVNVYDGVLREDAALLLTETCHAARGVLTTLRHLNLGWIAAERAVQAANLVGDPLLMAACMYNLVEVYSTSGANQPARQLAQGALGRLSQAGTAPREEWSLAGMLHLKLGLAAAVLGDRQCAYEHLNEAKAAAGRVGDGHNDFETMFGPTEVAIHRLGIAAELGDGTEALASLRNLDPASIRAKRRQSRLHIDIARTQINGGKHESALRSLVTAEQTSPEYARNHPATREIVSVMLHRERRTIRSELRSLADRIGIL